MSNMYDIKSEVEKLTGTQKSAIVCLALGREFSRNIFQRISEEEAVALSYELSSMSGMSKEVTEAVLSEYGEYLRGAEYLAQGGFGYAKDLLTETYGGKKAEDILRRVQKELADTGLGRLRKADPEQLRNLLRGQHPQIVALVLAHMEAKHVALVIGGFDPELGHDVLLRMGRMEKVSPQALDNIERSMAEHAGLAFSQGMSAVGGPSVVAEILNHTTTNLEKTLLERMGDRDPEITEEIKNLMFVFEDIVLLDDRHVQIVLRSLESKDLALALKTSGPDIKDKVYRNMSERASNSLREEMEYLGTVRVRDVDQARTRIVQTIRSLEEKGEIVISAGSGEDALVS